MKTRDLVRKYGWEVMIYLSNLGVNLLADANVWFVDNEHSDALNADDGVHGHSFEVPLSTINYAVSLCTDNQGDIILVAPGHTETISDTGTASGTTTDELAIDKAGVSIIGLSRGSLRPTITLDGATDAAITFLAGSTDCLLKNFLIISDLADVAAAITLSATSDGTRIEDCEFRDGGAAKEMIYGIEIAAACSDVVIKSCRFFTTAGGSSTLSAIFLTGAADRIVIEDCYFHGDWNTNGVIDNATAASASMLIKNNVLHNLDAATGKCIVCHASSTGVLVGNMAHGGLDGTSPFTVAGLAPFENYVTNAEGASGIISPGVDS
jgi:hypothetical protein